MFNYLFSVQNCPAPDYTIHNNRNNIDIKFPANGFNPYITVADDVSSLGFLTLLVVHLKIVLLLGRLVASILSASSYEEMTPHWSQGCNMESLW